MIAAAREADPEGEYVEADAAALPFEDGSADLVIAFMSLMDMDEMPASVRELARVLEPGGLFVTLEPGAAVPAAACGAVMICVGLGAGVSDRVGRPKRTASVGRPRTNDRFCGLEPHSGAPDRHAFVTIVVSPRARPEGQSLAPRRAPRPA